MYSVPVVERTSSKLTEQLTRPDEEINTSESWGAESLVVIIIYFILAAVCKVTVDSVPVVGSARPPS